MTTILIAETDHEIFIAADKKASTGHRAFVVNKIICKKIDKRNMFYAGCGAANVKRTLEDLDLSNCHYHEKEDIFILNDVFKRLKDKMKEREILELKESKVDSRGAAFIVFNNIKYEIFGDFTIYEMKEKMNGMGSGGDFALGYIEANAHCINEVSMRKAIDCACKYDNCSGLGVDIEIIKKNNEEIHS